MRRAILWILAACCLLAGPAFAQEVAPAAVDPDGRVARFVKADLSKLLEAAPTPGGLPAELTLKLIDYVDCTADDDVHPFLSDGMGRVATSPAGACRETGPTANSWFAYRLRVATPSRPHVVVLQFPDDGDRLAALGLAQPPSGAAQPPAARVEFGYRTGDLLPVSGRMVTRWTFFYPTSAEPVALLVANWHARRPAALARAWVYEVQDESLPAAESREDKFLRSAGRYDGEPSVVATRYSGKRENLIAELGYLGMNCLAVDALRGRTFYYPSARFGTGSEDIPGLLTSLEGTPVRCTVVFDPDCSVGAFTMPGQSSNVADIGEGEVRKAWQEMITWDFLKPLGAKPALGALMFGGPRGASAWDLKNNDGQTAFVQAIAQVLSRQYGGVRVWQNLAAASPHQRYLQGPGADWQPMNRWELSDRPAADCVAEAVFNHWKAYGLDEETLADIDDVVLMRQCGRDEAAARRFGHEAVPRYWMLDEIADNDVVTGRAGGAKLSGLVLASRAAPRMILLRPGEFWWSWPEMSPTLAPGGTGFFVPVARAMAAGLEPYVLTLAADGGAAAALHEADVRRWVTTFRDLPYRSFAPLEDVPQYPIAVRSYMYNGRRYVLMLNRASAPASVTLDFGAETAVRAFGEPVEGKPAQVTRTLSPDDLEVFVVAASAEIGGVTQATDDVRKLLAERYDRFAADLAAAGKAGVTCAPRYESTRAAAEAALKDGRLEEADRLLDPVVVREPGLRLRLATARPKADVQRLANVIVDGKLDEWKDVAPIRLDSAASLIAMTYAANHWKDPDDLSAELYLGWNDLGLAFALVVHDDQPTADENEASLLALSGKSYRSYTDRTGYDYSLHLSRVAEESSERLVTRREGKRTIHEGLIVAKDLPPALRPAAGRTVGLNLVVCDSDDRTDMPYAWCLSNVMAWSLEQDGYHVLSDAQTCGEITFR